MMRLSSTLVAIGIVGASLMTGTAKAAVVLDQSFLPAPNLSEGIGDGSAFVQPSITQTFAVGVSGVLSAVDASIFASEHAAGSTVTASIYEVIAGAVGTTALGTISFPASSLKAGPALIPPINPLLASELSAFDFASDDIAVTAGEELALVVSATSGSSASPPNFAIGADFDAAPGYAGGTLTLNPGGATGRSLGLQTFVDTPLTVPEPASAALLGFGLLGLLAVQGSRRDRV